MEEVSTIGLDLAKSVFQVHWDRCGRPGGGAPAVASGRGSWVLREAAALPGRYGSLRHCSSLGP